jgi:hypothetical protein
MSGGFAESDAEEAALGWLETLGYGIKHVAPLEVTLGLPIPRLIRLQA